MIRFAIHLNNYDYCEGQKVKVHGDVNELKNSRQNDPESGEGKLKNIGTLSNVAAHFLDESDVI